MDNLFILSQFFTGVVKRGFSEGRNVTWIHHELFATCQHWAILQDFMTEERDGVVVITFHYIGGSGACTLFFYRPPVVPVTLDATSEQVVV